MASVAIKDFDDQLRRMTPVSAPVEQKADVEAFSKAVGRAASATKVRALKYTLVGPKGEGVAVPESVFSIIVRVAEVLARGDAITLVPVGKEITTQQAADILNVSRQYVVRLLNEGRIPYTKTGKHRRLRIEDVLSFKEGRDLERETALDELTALSEEIGGYGELK